MSGSGGAAAHAGIDFQQRIAALVMLQMLVGTKNYVALQLGDALDVNELRFETDDAIDDLVLNTSRGRVFIQAKRTIHLSSGEGSEFSSVIRQFVRQHIYDDSPSDVYLLATSSRSSRRITQELKRITDSRRLNESSSDANPATQSEMEVLAKTRELAEAHYLDLIKQKMPAESFEHILRKMRVALLDIESGSPLESAVLTLICGHADLPANVIWGALIAFAVSLAKDRLSVDRSGLDSKMSAMFRSRTITQTDETTPKLFSPFQLDGHLSSGRDVILVESFVESSDYLIMELFRFNDDGSRRLRYSHGNVHLLNGMKLRVLHRTATFAGMERFLEECSPLNNDDRVNLLLANDTDGVEAEPFVIAHEALCRKLLSSSGPTLRCVRCGDPVSESSTPSIEIDEEDAELQVGLCHRDCVRPTDRVIGVIRCDFFESNKSLRNFNYDQWFGLLPRGQGVFRSAGQLPGVKVMLWNPGFKHSTFGQWCVRIDLVDGSARYAHERGRVARCGLQEAEEQATNLNESFESAKLKSDPWCYTSVSDTFTTYVAAMKYMSADESCTECVGATATRYSASIGGSYSEVDGYYAPLMMLLEESSGDPIAFQNTIFLLTEPLSLEKYLESWRRAGLIVPRFIVSIIATDAEFDTLMRQLHERDLTVLVDPLLDPSGGLSRGIRIDNFEEVMRTGKLARLEET
ncbi:hypothetical protein [Pseudoxanthomonas sacheonensis]|uniref:Restriction endonuclease type IV Mrr domain-containing protein n=1 Tax=Pseudoxanthomonas sacheonensis TaxID=443615 RepID=A0ABU1RR12_9GAMM|nr:hypothetical protein [Pseudoxanthomonas sacheonensis]MDR6841207.1 hypothetical protein [Pseudoxanthomonas sacheonensis]